MRVTSIVTAFLHGFFLPVTGIMGILGTKMSINRNHSRTECKNSLEMSILRGVFDGDINYDCIFTGFFEAPEAPVTDGRTLGETGGTRLAVTPLQHFKKMNKNPLG